MSSLEKINMLQQTTQNLEGLRRDMRANAIIYMGQIGTAPAVEIANLMKADADQYLQRLGWQKTINSDSAKYQKLKDTFLVLGADEQSYLDDIAELELAANLQAAVTATDADVNDKAAAVLSSVPEHDSVW